MTIRRIDSAAHSIIKTARNTAAKPLFVSQIKLATGASTDPVVSQDPKHSATPSTVLTTKADGSGSAYSPMRNATSSRLRLLNHSSVSQNISALLREPLLSHAQAPVSRTSTPYTSAESLVSPGRGVLGQEADDTMARHPAMTVQESIAALLRRHVQLRTTGSIEAKELARAGVFGSGSGGRLFELSL